MPELPPFRRYETLSGVEYEIRNSKQTGYYTVPLLNGFAVSCECRFAQFHASCKHQEDAERLEKELFSQPLDEPCEEVEAVAQERSTALHRTEGFSLTGGR